MLYDHFQPSPPEDILSSIIQALVSAPEEVEIERVESPGSTIFTIHVIPDDRGKIIGRQGAIIKSLNTLFHALGGKNGKQFFLEIQDN